MDVGIPMRFSLQTKYNGQFGVLWVFQLKGRIPEDWSQFTYLTCIILNVCFRLCKGLEIQTANKIFAAHIRSGIQIMQTRKTISKEWVLFPNLEKKRYYIVGATFLAYLKSCTDLSLILYFCSWFPVCQSKRSNGKSNKKLWYLSWVPGVGFQSIASVFCFAIFIWSWYIISSIPGESNEGVICEVLIFQCFKIDVHKYVITHRLHTFQSMPV